MTNLNCDRALRIQGKTARQATLERLCAWTSVSAVSNHPPRTPRATRQQPTPSGHPENTQIQAKIISISPQKKKATFLTTTTVHDWERRSVQISISFAQSIRGKRLRNRYNSISNVAAFLRSLWVEPDFIESRNGMSLIVAPTHLCAQRLATGQ